MKPTATPLTAALAGAFSAAAWMLAWPSLAAADTTWLILATVVFVAVPAHVFVVGLQRAPGDPRQLDRPQLTRIGAWLLSALAVVGVMTLARG